VPQARLRSLRPWGSAIAQAQPLLANALDERPWVNRQRRGLEGSGGPPSLEPTAGIA